MCSEQMLRQFEDMAADPRFRAMSTLDLQNILTAIEVCGVGFSRGPKVVGDLNRLLTDEWPARHDEAQLAMVEWEARSHRPKDFLGYCMDKAIES